MQLCTLRIGICFLKNPGHNLEKSWDIVFCAVVAARREFPLYSHLHTSKKRLLKTGENGCEIGNQGSSRQRQSLCSHPRGHTLVDIKPVGKPETYVSAIYQIKAASLTFRSTERPSNASADDINELFPKLAGLTSAEATRFIQSSSIKEMKFLSFLVKFRELRSISLEFTCPRIVCSSSLFKMRVKFSRGGAVVEKFVSIVSNSVCKEAEQVHGYMGYESPRNKSSISGTFLPLASCTNWLLALCLLFKCNPSLETIAITNGKKQGKLVLKDDELVAWRNSFVPGGLLHDFTPYASTRGWIVKLHMPESGYLLKGVDFVIARPGDDSYSESSGAADADEKAICCSNSNKTNQGITAVEY